MAQGGAAAASPGWSWAGAGAGAGADDWALTLLALAVVAATALALHWFGSRQDPEAAGPASAVPGTGLSRAGGTGPALLPGAEVSGGGQGRGSGQGGTGDAGHAQAAAGACAQASPGGLAAPAAPPLETPREVACGGPLGQQRGHTPEAPPSKGREPLRAGSSKVGGTSAALLIHFTPQSPGREEEVRAKAGGLRAQVPVPRGLTGQDSSPWKQGSRPPSSLGRGPGGPPQANHGSGHSVYRPPKLDHLRLGTVVSVWDTVDAASGLWATPVRPSAQAGALGDGSEGGLRKGSSPTASVLALGSAVDGGKSGETGPPAFRESRGSPGSVEGWPWARREVLVTGSFSQASDATRSWPEARQWGHSPLSQGWGATEGGAAVSMGRGTAEEPGGHRTPEERGSGQGQGDPGSSRQPAEYPQPLGSPPTAPRPSGAFPAAPTLPASSSDLPPSWVPPECGNLGPCEPTAPSRASKRDSQPVPRPRKRSPGEAVESAQGVHPAAPERSPRERSPGERSPGAARGARRGARPTEAQLEARRLLAFLQRPGSWGAPEGAGRPSARAPEPAALAAWRQRLDLGSCPDALAFARRHGEPGLARAAYALLSDHLLRALGQPGLYRRLSAAERQRVLSLRTGRGPAVLGVLALPGLYQAGRPGPARGPPAAPPAPRAPRPHLHVLDPRENAWRPLAPVPDEAPLRGCGLCTMHNYLFLAGGVRGSGARAVCSNRVFCYNPLTNAWGQVRPMRQARAQLKLVALDGQLYAIGGECLYSVERYDPRADAWAARAPLPAGTFPVAHEAVACRGDIYVTGGHLFCRLLRYRPEQDAWDERPYSAGHRRSSDMVALGAFLYRFDLLRGVGAAVTRYNTVTGSWSRAASLPLPRPLPLRCAVLGDTIYCLNQQVTATLVVCEGTARFQAKGLQPFPLGSKDVLCPFTLTLPAADPQQIALGAGGRG
ncbi:kelch domain-containing protein 7B [Talpa occidentalis]|uniref:kelch domain-containing protein 7B n=1 Tax=Talpa occidentalis TaxID=50954 RepID=UPI001890AD19|nr:kelch domain-containing protein 7B [Talpa occidentalis]